MEINFHQLEIFLSVVRERSFSQAAAKLRISQPSVSIQIKKLEDSLAVKLFERVRHHVHLTSEGALVLEHAKKMFEAVCNLQSEVEKFKGARLGRVLMGCSRVPSARLVPLAVAGFRRQYPESEISVRTGRSHEVEQWIVENDVDLGVIEGDPNEKVIAKEPAYADELVLVLPPQSRLLKRQRLLLRDVAEEPFLLQAPGVRAPFIERVFAEKGIVIKKPITVGSREAVKTSIAAGCGVSVLPWSVVNTEIRAGILKAKKVDDLDIKYPMSIIYRRDKPLSVAARAFLDTLRKQCHHLSRQPSVAQKQPRTVV